MHRTIKEWQFERKTRLSPRLANQALMDLLWEDLPEILTQASKLEAVRDHCKNMRGTAHEFRKPIDAILDPLDEILAGRWQECHCEVCEEPAATEGGGDE